MEILSLILKANLIEIYAFFDFSIIYELCQTKFGLFINKSRIANYLLIKLSKKRFIS